MGACLSTPTEQPRSKGREGFALESPDSDIITGTPTLATEDLIQEDSNVVVKNSRDSQSPQLACISSEAILVAEKDLSEEVEEVQVHHPGVHRITSRNSDQAHTSRGDESEHSLQLLQMSLETALACSYNNLTTKAAGIRHLGFGKLKRCNQDEFAIHVGGFGGVPNGCLYGVFDGHGSFGGEASAFCSRELPMQLDCHLKELLLEGGQLKSPAQQEAVKELIKMSFLRTEERLRQTSVNTVCSGTTASVIYQNAHSLWVASAGDSRVLLIHKPTPSQAEADTCVLEEEDEGEEEGGVGGPGQGKGKEVERGEGGVKEVRGGAKGLEGRYRCTPLTIDHRPARMSEKQRSTSPGHTRDSRCLSLTGPTL